MPSNSAKVSNEGDEQHLLFWEITKKLRSRVILLLTTETSIYSKIFNKALPNIAGKVTDKVPAIPATARDLRDPAS